MMRLHVLGIPHTQTTNEFNGCAFTAKVHKFLEMMSGRGYEIFHYGHTNRDWSYPDVTHVPVITDQDHSRAYGDAYVTEQSWRATGFTQFGITDSVYTTFTRNAVQAIKQRQQPTDILCVTFGYGHKSIADQLPEMITVETGIGYPAVFAKYRIYESYAVMHAFQGQDNVLHCNQDWYHRVIPNYFRDSEFTYSDRKDDYILYLGRIGRHKGVNIAIEAAERANKRLIIAGQGDINSVGVSVPSTVEVVGYADIETRKQLMANAQALFIASGYLEPFGGVQVEAYLSGTPVISTDWGAFAEYNIDGVTGFRCRTFKDFVHAIDQTRDLDPQTIRTHGEQFLMPAIAPKFDRYFQDIQDIYTGNGWYQM